MWKDNYIHMLGIAHISHYMKQHGNLCKCSQQGWESLIEKFKLAFFNHSEQGGNFVHKGVESARSCLKSIFLYFQREVLWIVGVADEYFYSRDYNKANLNNL
jgi:hypothetical protein